MEFKRRMFDVRKQKNGIIKELEYDCQNYISVLRPEEIVYLEYMLNEEFMVLPSKG